MTASVRSEAALLGTLLGAEHGLTLAEALTLHPDIPRRTAQRHISRWLAEGRLNAEGEGRARRYWAPVDASSSSTLTTREDSADRFLTGIPLSPDSRDVLAYIDQPLTQRRPVGWQREFLDDYQPNRSAYLSEALRRQLHRMGRTEQIGTPAGTYSRAILNRLLIDLSWASSHLEGNTYSRLDTRRLIEDGQAASGKAALETQMILNHKAAIELLVESVADPASSIGLNRYTLQNLHSALSENLLTNPADEGRLRRHAVEIGQSVYRPLAAPPLIDEAFGVLLAKADAITDPFEQSFFLLVHLPYLQPFADMNKRSSRLAANLPLFRANLCPLTFLDVPEAAYSRAMFGVYELTRIEPLRDLYVWAYERSTQEYLAIHHDVPEPDPLRLAWRALIRTAVRQVVQRPGEDAVTLVRQCVAHDVTQEEQREAVAALIMDELRRLHEGVLARYGLRPGEWRAWVQKQRAGEHNGR